MHDIENRNFAHEAEAESYYSPGSGVFNPNQEMELASELMEISNEQELEQFLGDLISKAGSAIGSFVRSPVGQALGGVLKNVAKQALPVAGQALGGYLGGSAGAQIGGQLGSAASGMLGEMEAENEFEAAQTFVRLAGDAVRNAANAPPGANPQSIAQAAVSQAAQIHAPGLPLEKPQQGFGGQPGGGGVFSRGHSGRWIRRGGKIVLFGA